MLRRAALAATLLLAISVNLVSAANASVTVTDNRYSATTVTVGFGNQVTWTAGSPQQNHHTATSNLTAARGWAGMAWSVDFQPNSTGQNGSQTFHQAGGWQFHCLIHGNMRGTVNVNFTSSSLTGTLATTFVLTLGDQALPAGFVHDIQKRKVGGSFKTWKTTGTSTQSWKPAKKGKFQFRTRVRNTANGDATLYSPQITITVS
jgi:plastocyanin